jgi:hypothetical protein
MTLDTIRRPRHPEWRARYELVAEVTSGVHCANFIKTGETLVFDLDGVIDAQRSTANLCLGILARIQPALLMAADRAREGLHPVSAGWNSFDCFDTGLDHGGTGKVTVRMRLRERATGRFVEDAAAEPDAA